MLESRREKREREKVLRTNVERRCLFFVTEAKRSELINKGWVHMASGLNGRTLTVQINIHTYKQLQILWVME